MGTDPRPCHCIYQGLSSREGGIRTRDLSLPNAPEAVLGRHWRFVVAERERMCDECAMNANGRREVVDATAEEQRPGRTDTGGGYRAGAGAMEFLAESGL